MVAGKVARYRLDLPEKMANDSSLKGVRIWQHRRMRAMRKRLTLWRIGKRRLALYQWKESFLVKDYACPIVLGDGENSAATLALKLLIAPITNEQIDALFGGDEL